MRVLRLWPQNSAVDFMRYHPYGFMLSAALSVLTYVFLAVFHVNMGLDFRGGTLIEVQPIQGQLQVEQLRARLTKLDVGTVEIQEIRGTDRAELHIRRQDTPETNRTLIGAIRSALGDSYAFVRVETVGPKVSKELILTGLWGLILAIVAVWVYLSLRFSRALALGAMIGTLHDLLLMVGVLSVSQLEFNMTSIAALLTIIGYSLNETVVVFDRTRELLSTGQHKDGLHLLNASLNTTMSRTMMTASAALLSVTALLVFGGEAIRGFSILMLVGIVICTYSAIFISTPSLLYVGGVTVPHRHKRRGG